MGAARMALANRRQLSPQLGAAECLLRLGQFSKVENVAALPAPDRQGIDCSCNLE
jgi:hypothetical protein